MDAPLSLKSTPRAEDCSKDRASRVDQQGPAGSLSTVRTESATGSAQHKGGSAIDHKHSPSQLATPLAGRPRTESNASTATAGADKEGDKASESSQDRASMSTASYNQESTADSTPPASSGESATLPPYTHSAPPTVTSFPHQQSQTTAAAANAYTPSHHGVSHDYSAYSQGVHQSSYTHQPNSAMLSQHITPPPTYGNTDAYASGDSRLGHSFSSASCSPAASNFSAPQHYYHSSVPTHLDDLRHAHHSHLSSSAYSRSSSSHQPYYVPSQPLRAPVYTAAIGGGAASSMHQLTGSSIIANPDSLPDIRYSDGMSAAAAAAAAAASGMLPHFNYGRLPNGKIIELYPAMMRTIQACEYCRSRKAKCSGGLPCERCKKKNMKCEYAQLDKKRKVKTTTSEVDMSNGIAAAARSATTPVKVNIALPSGATNGSEMSGTAAAVATGIKTRSATVSAGDGPKTLHLAACPSLSSASYRGDALSVPNTPALPCDFIPLTLTSSKLDANEDSEESDSASLRPVRLSPPTSDAGSSTTSIPEYVAPDALWSDATVNATPDETGRKQASHSSYYGESEQGVDWGHYT